jgi:hypothetical protein
MLHETSLLELCFLYNAFAKRGTILFIAEGALRSIVRMAQVEWRKKDMQDFRELSWNHITK